MRKKATINDVALAAGVSKATVSNFLNRRSANYSADTADRIRKAMSRLRYIPDPGARGIKSMEGGRSIGIMLRNRIDQAMTALYFQRILPVIGEVLDVHDYRALVIPETHDRQRDIAYMRELAKGLIAGYFIFDMQDADDPYVEALELDGINFVAIGHNPRVRNFVASRHDLGVETAVTHLIRDHGASRIVLLPGKTSRSVGKDRVKGYRSALDAAGLPFDDTLLLPGLDAAEVVPPGFGGLLAGAARPDAVLVTRELLRGVQDRIAAAGLRIPDDIRLVLLDPVADPERGEYASIAIRMEQVGRMAAEKMLSLVRRPPIESGVVFLDVDFHPGRSCGCQAGGRA